MRHIRIPRFFFALIAAMQVLLCAPAAMAQFTMEWNTVDGGGGTSTNGSLSISGTVGQPDASLAMTGGSLSMTGGFWPGAGPINDCPADTNLDNLVNVTDLLAVIGAWGTCAGPCPPSACPADINDDCFINVTDLLAVIGAWGACP